MKRVTIGDVAKSIGMSYSLVCKILNSDPNFKPAASTRSMVIRKAQEMGFDYSGLRRIHRRKHRRVIVNLSGQITIKKKQTSEVFDTGTAVIKDLSPGGGFLTGIKLSKDSLPACPFQCELKIIEGKLKGMSLKGNPVRLKCNGDLFIGLEFFETSGEQRHRLAGIA
jgi:hypothetical protein